MPLKQPGFKATRLSVCPGLALSPQHVAERSPGHREMGPRWDFGFPLFPPQDEGSDLAYGHGSGGPGTRKPGTRACCSCCKGGRTPRTPAKQSHVWGSRQLASEKERPRPLPCHEQELRAHGAPGGVRLAHWGQWQATLSPAPVLVGRREQVSPVLNRRDLRFSSPRGVRPKEITCRKRSNCLQVHRCTRTRVLTSQPSGVSSPVGGWNEASPHKISLALSSFIEA